MKDKIIEILDYAKDALNEVNPERQEDESVILKNVLDQLTELNKLLSTQADYRMTDDEIYTCMLKGGKEACSYESKDSIACVLLRKCEYVKFEATPPTEDKVVEAEKFAEWLNKHRWYTFENGKWKYTFEHGTSISKEDYEKHYVKTTSELYKIFTQSQTKHNENKK